MLKIIEDLIILYLIIFTCSRFVIVRAYPLTKWRLPVTLMPVMLLIDLYFFIFNCIVFSLGEKLFYDHIIINIGINIFYIIFIKC